MPLLPTIQSPADLKRLRREQLPQLAQEIRDRLIECVSMTGGHIGASLGVVELSIALLYEFDSPKDKVVWDVGHQAYAWKLLTGRNDPFTTLRQREGISGFLKRTESEHDHFGAGHAGTAMSAALGMATARDLRGESHKVVAVVGDGALTCGLSYEGMNNAGHSERDIILIVNDNGMSISPNVGAISKTLGRIVADPRTNRVREKIKGMTFALGGVFGDGVVDFAKNVEESVKNLFSPGMLFEELGFRYFGPIDGHDLPKLCDTLRFVRGMSGPRVIHVMTQKGKGFALRRGQPGKVARARGVRPGHRRGAEEGERPADLDPGLRRRAHGAGARSTPSWWRSRRPCRSGTGHQHLPEAAPGTVLRRRHRRGPRGHVRRRAGDAGHPSGRRHLQHLPPARLRQRHPRHRRAASAGDRSAWTARDWSARTARPTWGCTTSPTCWRCPGMTVTAPKDGDELIGLLRTRAGAHRRPLLHPLSPRQGAGRAAPAGGDSGGAVRKLGAAPPGQGRRDSGGRHDGAAGARRRPSCSPPTGSTARW